MQRVGSSMEKKGKKRLKKKESDVEREKEVFRTKVLYLNDG